LVLNIAFGGIELANYGLVTPGVQGTHDLAGIVVSQTFVPGYALPNESVLRDDLISMSIPCVVNSEVSHADLVTKLQLLRTYLSPRRGWKTLTVTDVASKRTLARCEAFPVKIDSLPYFQTVVEFNLSFLRAPWWEDATAQTDNITTSPDSVSNTGDLECWPVYTATVTATMAGGLSFTVGGQTWVCDHPLAVNDVLVITTELPDCTKNGTRYLHGVTAASIYPGLGVGANAITLSDDSKFSLGMSWRRRYE
jgi:hypothetical protein